MVSMDTEVADFIAFAGSSVVSGCGRDLRACQHFPASRRDQWLGAGAPARAAPLHRQSTRTPSDLTEDGGPAPRFVPNWRPHSVFCGCAV